MRRSLVDQGYKRRRAAAADPRRACASRRRARYIAAYEQITGSASSPDTEEPIARIRKNLGLEVMKAKRATSP